MPVISGLGLEGGDIVVDEAWLDGGTDEGGDSLVQHGTFTLEAQGGIRSLTVAGEEITWEQLLSLAEDGPVVIELPSGNKVSITGFSGDLYGGEVSYSYELTGNTLAHDDQGRDEFGKEVSVVLEDRFDNTADADISVVIIDDIPGQFEGSGVIQVPISEVIVGDWAAGWININTTNGQYGAEDIDVDDFKDLISWGTPVSGSQGSNYVFEDNDDLRDLSTGKVDQTFVLGTFTHNNFPIWATGGVLESVDLTMMFTIVIDGVATQVEHTINIEHEETPNNTGTPEGDADIVTISNATTLVPIVVGDREFTFEILGFKRIGEPDGDPVSEVITFEDASNSFELIGRISSTDDLPTLTGQIEDPFWGADGPDEDEPLLWSTPEGDKAVAEGESLSIVGQYGTLIVYADGNYVYEVSREARDNMDIGEDKQDVFTYYLQDADGDRVPSTLTITLEGAVNSINLDSHEGSAEIVSETITPDPVPAGSIEGGGTIETTSSTHRNGVNDTWESSTFTVDEGGSGSFSFTANLSSPGNSSASLSWRLEKQDSSGEWQPVDGMGGSVGSGTHSVDDLESGEYRAVFEAEVSGRESNLVWPFPPIYNHNYPQVSVGGLEAEFQPDSYEEFSASPFAGNVLDGATPGSINSTLSVKLPGGEWQEIGDGGLTLVGDYGTLVIQKDGSYVYTPEANGDFIGQADAFELKLTHPAGESVTATLTIEIGGDVQPTGEQGGSIQATGFGLFAMEDLEALDAVDDEAASGDDTPAGTDSSETDTIDDSEEDELDDSEEEESTSEDESEDENSLIDIDNEETVPVVSDEVTEPDAESDQDDADSEEETSENDDSLTESELFDESEELLKGEGSEESQDESKSGVEDSVPVVEQEQIDTSIKHID